MHPMIWETANIQEETISRGGSKSWTCAQVPTALERISESCKNKRAGERKYQDHLDLTRLWEAGQVHYWTKQQPQASNRKHGRHADAPDVDASGGGTSDRAGFVVIIGQAAVLAAVKPAIRDEASKPKLVFLPRFRSVFFSIILVNVTILRFVVWHYLAYCEKIFNVDWITRWHAEAPGGHCTFAVFFPEHVQFSH
jgi:hypothetical protein